ncbi:aminotransferase class III-fold pyridoxal phosphate-dependent enzyme [Candidatus Binatus sp.]|uniref:aminotransferase class III-fold pyridoxal phosphate-dependent enzyme n=1 Tax=Candidatus Binatus sp. TaxID=2811406 RepID=UPI0032C2414A
MSSSGAVAAVLVEPFQGTAGNVIPPDDFLPAVKEVARQNDAMLIADEAEDAAGLAMEAAPEADRLMVAGGGTRQPERGFDRLRTAAI